MYFYPDTGFGCTEALYIRAEHLNLIQFIAVDNFGLQQRFQASQVQYEISGKCVFAHPIYGM